MNVVFLLGTSHTIQRDQKRGDFRQYISDLVKEHNLVAIGEEIDGVSIASEISASLQLTYKNIEPTPAERNCLGIPSLGMIEHDIHLEYDDVQSNDAKLERACRKEKSFRAREAEWLIRIKDMNTFPLLIICGAHHFKPFGDLLRANGIVVNEASSS